MQDACTGGAPNPAFANAKDQNKTIEVKNGTVGVSDANFTAVKWIGAFTDGAKKIVAVEDWYGGKVR